MNKIQYTIKARGDLLPREKAKQYGIAVLNDRELLKILIGSGQKNCPVDKIARQLLKLLDKTEGVPDLEELMSIKGMGMARSSLIEAAMEFSRRYYLPQNTKNNTPRGDLPPSGAYGRPSAGTLFLHQPQWSS